MSIYNIYCDESCHLENDHLKVMILGAVWCPSSKAKDIFREIRLIKTKHNLATDFEIKWTKVSESKVEFYLDIVDYFFNNRNLHLRALVVPDKTKLLHDYFHQDHDTWYYKMYFEMLKIIITPRNKYQVYADYKDTHGAKKIAKLHEVLCNSQYDFAREIIEKVQLVRSHEVELIQIADLFIGAVSYINRGLYSSPGKIKIIDHIRKRSGYSLVRSTLASEKKLNVFIWRPLECA